MQQRRKDGTLLVASGDTAGLLSLRTVPRTPTAASKELLRVSFDDDDDDDAEKADDKSKSKKPEPAIYDVDFSADGALVGACTEHRLVVFRTTPPRRRTASERKEVEDDDEAADESPVQVIERPVLRKDMTCTFRSAKCVPSALACRRPPSSQKLMRSHAQVWQTCDGLVALYSCQCV